MPSIDINYRLYLEAVIKDNYLSSEYIVKSVENNILSFEIPSNSFHVGYQYGLMFCEMDFNELKQKSLGIFTASNPMKLDTFKRNATIYWQDGKIMIFHSKHFDLVCDKFGAKGIGGEPLKKHTIGIKDNQIFYITREFIQEFCYGSLNKNFFDKRENEFKISSKWKEVYDWYQNDFLKNTETLELVKQIFNFNTNKNVKQKSKRKIGGF